MPTDSEFLQQVKDVLSHLYDYPYLESHPLALKYWPASEVNGPNRAQRLHRLLLENIEELHPPDTAVKGASRAEYYFLLVYRYVEEWPLPDIIQKLGYSRRQFFRQQQKAVEMLAGLVQEKISQIKPAPVEPDTILNDELERFRTRHRAVDLKEVVEGVFEIVNPLAGQHQVALTSHLPDELPVVYSSRTLLRQIFLTALSQLITQPGGRQIHLRLTQEKQHVAAELTALFDKSQKEDMAGSEELEPDTIRHLVEMMRGRWLAFEFDRQRCVCRFDFPIETERVLLVVEDNEGVIQAFRRFLAGYNYQVIGAATGAEALRLAREMLPAMITLDVMIPGQDGWEILHALKHDPATQHIPVVICSVLEDPNLAQALGAAAYLHKPVTQNDLLTTLERLS